MSGPGDRLEVRPLGGVGEVRAGDELVGLLAPLLVGAAVVEGDVVVVTSKVVSKAEGRVVPGHRDEHLAAETDRVVARRGPTSIVRTRLGLVMAAAGIDASNTDAGTVVLLPRDPDGSARRLREGLLHATGLNLGVVVTDTAGRAWRTGQTDIAVGVAGLWASEDYAGRVDAHGHELAVTLTALADEVAAAADLVKGKLAGRPVAVVRGLGHLVAAAGEHGAGAASLVRAETEDLFGLGAREAVTAALVESEPDLRGFGAGASTTELLERLRHVAGAGALVDLRVESAGPGRGSARAELVGGERDRGATEARLRAMAAALGWSTTTDEQDRELLLFSRRTP